MKKLFLLLGCVLMAATMSAVTYKGCLYQANDNYWTSPAYDENGEVAINVQVSDDKSTVTLKDWTGDTGVDLSLTLAEDGTIVKMNGKDPDSYSSQYLTIGSLTDGEYTGVFAYFPKNTLVTINEDGSGEGYFQVYSYNEDGGWKYVYFRWSTETVEEIAETEYPLTFYKTDDEDDDSWQSLPFGENNEYYATIAVASDLSYVILKNWTGETNANNAVDAKLMLTAEGNVVTINGLGQEGWGLDTGTVEDDGYYCVYVYPNNAIVEFSAEDGSEGAGYFYIYTWAEPAGYKSVNFYWPADPAGISTINTAVSDNAVYNLNGVRMNGDNLPKGVYIINGKKVVK